MRLYEANLALEPLCQACRCRKGTAMHRYYQPSFCCAAKEIKRLEMPARHWMHVAQDSDDAWLWTRGLAPHPEQRWKFIEVPEEGTTRWAVEQGENPEFTGDVYTDGSKLGTSRDAQTGFAVVQMNNQQECMVVSYGPCQSNCRGSVQSRGRTCGLCYGHCYMRCRP